MKRKFYSILLILLATSAVIRADFKSEIYSAYISNNMSQWKTIIDRINLVKPMTNELLLELVNYQYGYIGWCVSSKMDEEAEKYLGLAEKNLNILKSRDANLSLVNSYMSAFYGFKIGLNKLKVVFLAPKSLECAREAVRLDSLNYIGYVQFGNIEFYTPSAFGGSKKEALEFYLKAEKILAGKTVEIYHDWNYLSLLTVIAQSYSYLGDS